MIHWIRWVLLVLVFCATDGYAEKTPPKVQYATGFEVAYFEHYKIVTVKQPWRNAQETFQYVLVDRGTKPPKGYEPHQIFEVPVHGFVPMSTSFLPQVDVLGIQNQLVALDGFKFVNTPSVRALIEKGKLKELGHGNTMDLEMLVTLHPGLVMVNAYGNPQSDAHIKLRALGIPVVVVGDYMEAHPLGRAEWVKFTALFFNKEAEAEKAFEEIAREYERLAKLGHQVKKRPTVLTGTSWRGTWFLPGGKSYMAQFLKDAGADYLWKDDDSTGGIPMDFETVLAQGQNADFWVNADTWHGVSDALVADIRYGEFKALKTRQMYNRDGKVNSDGGNDYFETGAMYPQRVLADLIKIFHPELVPEHQLIWYQQLAPQK